MPEAGEVTESVMCGFALVCPASSTVPGTWWVPSRGLLNRGMGGLLLVNTFWPLLITSFSCLQQDISQSIPALSPFLFLCIYSLMRSWLVPIRTNNSQFIFNPWLSPGLQVFIQPLPPNSLSFPLLHPSNKSIESSHGALRKNNQKESLPEWSFHSASKRTSNA